MSLAFAASEALKTQFNSDLLTNPELAPIEQTTSLDAQPTSEQRLRGILKDLRPNNPDILANINGNPLYFCDYFGTGNCYRAVERINTFWGPRYSNKYCQKKYGTHPQSFAKRMRIANVPTPVNFCWQIDNPQEEA